MADVGTIVVRCRWKGPMEGSLGMKYSCQGLSAYGVVVIASIEATLTSENENSAKRLE